MNEQQTKTPKWLQRLERESWQAELVISGLAIFASLQLPALINDFAIWAIKNLIDPGWLMYNICWFLYLASYVIIYAFILHFILRTIWIGFIGLNSVFPKGIKKEGVKKYSSYFLDRVIKDYPVGSLRIQTLDNLCSSIFATCTVSATMFLIFTFNMVILLGLKYLLSLFIPTEIIEIMGWGLLGIISLYSMTFFFLNLKRNHQNEKMQSLFYKMFKGYNKFFLHIFHRPLNYISLILMTNVRNIQHPGKIFFIFIILFSLPAYQMKNSSILRLPEVDRYYEFFEQDEETFINYYEDELLVNNHPVFTAFIQSQVIRGKTMKLFIPVLGHESEMLAEACGEWEKNGTWDRYEKRKIKLAFYKACYPKYHRIYLNDRLVNAELLICTHPIQNTEGVLTFLSTASLTSGKNTVKVEKYSPDSDKVFRTVIIPFWFEEG